MLRIAICDDQEIYRSAIEQFIESYVPKTYEPRVNTFSSGEELIGWYQSHHADIIFLDIKMKELDGLATAERIRKKDKNATIVFLTSFQDYAIKGYEVSAFRYLIKEDSQQLLDKKLKEFFQAYFTTTKFIKFQAQNRTQFVTAKDIVSVEIQNRMICLKTKAGVYEFYGKLSDFEEQLLHYDSFVKPHRSFLVNLEYVRHVGDDHITMANKDQIPLSRNEKKTVLSKYIAFRTDGEL